MHGVTLIKNNIEELLDDFYKVTGILIAFVSYDETIWIDAPKEKSEFCSLLRSNPLFKQKCLLCDKQAFNASKMVGELYVYECHAGLREAVSPIIYDGKSLGYLMMGQTLNRQPNKVLWESLCSRYTQYNIDLQQLESAFYKLKYLEPQILYSAARIMDISAKYIHLNKLAKINEPQLLQKIKSFAEDNLNRPIKTANLSKQFNLSSSYISHIIKDNLRMSFTEYLMIRRLTMAKQLLEQSNMKIQDIALQVGIPEQNYFARVFKKHVGLSPTEYRIQNTK